MGNGWNTVSTVLFWKRELTEFCGNLGEFPREASTLISKIRSCITRTDLKNKAFSSDLCQFLRSVLRVRDRIIKIRVLACLGFSALSSYFSFFGGLGVLGRQHWLLRPGHGNGYVEHSSQGVSRPSSAVDCGRFRETQERGT